MHTSRERSHWTPLKATLVIGAVVISVFFAIIFVGCIYIGTVGPDTAVYTANQVPRRFIETAKQVGALEEGESLVYFYSDALVNIKDGFYFVSDRKVAVYSEAAGDPLTIVRFDEIEDAKLDASDSFFTDSEITLRLKDGRVVSFPVSSENGKDRDFHDEILRRLSGDSSSS